MKSVFFEHRREKAAHILDHHCLGLDFVNQTQRRREQVALIVFAQLLTGHRKWRAFHASQFGVSQLRPRVVIVALRNDLLDAFEWPDVHPHNPPSVGQLLKDLMAVNGWKGAEAWAERASDIAPTIVGGSKKHGGPDLGPTRARQAWAAMGVEGRSMADAAPPADFVGMPRLTVRMVARLQGFPDDWQFYGRKTAAYRQVGNAFPPPVAKAVAERIRMALRANLAVPVRAVA